MEANEERITANDIIAIVLQRMKQDIIKNYCCLFEVPPEGKLLWADLAFDLAQSGTGGDALQGSVVASASMGDVSYTFKNGENNTITAGALAENYRYRLDKMRRGLFR